MTPLAFDRGVPSLNIQTMSAITSDFVRPRVHFDFSPLTGLNRRQNSLPRPGGGPGLTWH